MNTKQLAVGSFGLASADYLTSQAKSNVNQLSGISDEALQIGLGMAASEAGNRMDNDMGVMKPISTAMLLSGGAGVLQNAGADLGSLLGGGNTSAMYSGGGSTASASSASGGGQTAQMHDMSHSATGGGDVVDY